MNKFGRNYELGLSTQDKGALDLFINLPFTVEFDITRNTLTSANVCQLRIYNLSDVTRNRIRKDVSDYGNFRSVVFKAGYGNNISTIFSGNISQAWSVREGVNFITQIECFDGGFAYVNGSCNLNFPAGTLLKVVITAIAGTLPDVTIGAIGDYPGTLSKANSYSGNSMFILDELTGGGAFIDNGKFYALGTNEFAPQVSGVTVINSNSGLLNTPVLENQIVHFDMIFEPGLTVGQQIVLDSFTAASGFNGVYKITAVKHRGMISPTVCGSAITTGEFFNNKEVVAANLNVSNLSAIA